MALMKWDPFTVLTRLDTTFDELMRRNFGVASGVASGGRNQHFVPGVDMSTDGADVVISMELPGVDPDDIDIEVAGGMLTISGERKLAATRAASGGQARP